MNKGIDFDIPLNEQIFAINRSSNAPVTKCKRAFFSVGCFDINNKYFLDNLLFQAEKKIKEGDLKSVILCVTEALSAIAKIKYTYDPNREAVTWNRSELNRLNLSLNFLKIVLFIFSRSLPDNPRGHHKGNHKFVKR